MGEFTFLTGGVPDKNFNIQKWTADDRSGKLFQYNPRYKEESLLETQNPVRTLPEAKGIIKDWYGKRVIYLRFRKQGRILPAVESQLMEKGMI